MIKQSEHKEIVLDAIDTYMIMWGCGDAKDLLKEASELVEKCKKSVPKGIIDSKIAKSVVTTATIEHAKSIVTGTSKLKGAPKGIL
jgi:hypothetical protein